MTGDRVVQSCLSDGLHIHHSGRPDLQDILVLVRAAFGGEEVAALVNDLLHDPSAEPLVSLVARVDGRAVGYVLFTRAVIEPLSDHTATILAPLAVIPEFQKSGIGGKLIDAGMKVLIDDAVSLVFVLGYPEYYPRHGFEPAGRLGLDAPYFIPEKNSDAWMVRELRPTVLGKVRGTVHCAETMHRPEYWRE